MVTKPAETFAGLPDDIPLATNGLRVPTFFVEHIRGTIVSRGFIKLNMIENRLDATEGDIKAVHVVTIVTPTDQVRAWAKYLTDIADQNGWAEEGVTAPEGGQPTDGQ